MSVDRLMKSSAKIFELGVVAALCAAFAAGPGLAQEGTAGGAVAGSASHAGIGARAQPGASSAGAAGGNFGAAAVRRPAMPLNAITSPQTAGINGTMMGHIASGPSSVGGPAKDRSSINGTTMRPKH